MAGLKQIRRFSQAQASRTRLVSLDRSSVAGFCLRAVAAGVAIACLPVRAAVAFEVQTLVSLPPLVPMLAAVELPPSPQAELQVLPDFPSFNSRRLDHQIRLYTRYVMTEGTPDVLIIGSSRALQGIDPDVLRQALAERGHGNLRVYNFSINGATARVIDFVVRRVLPPDRLPRLMIWADGLRAFNSAKTDVTFNGIATSSGYRQLAQGSLPIPPIAAVEKPKLEAPPEICLEIPPVPALSKPVVEASDRPAPDLPPAASSPALQKEDGLSLPRAVWADEPPLLLNDPSRLSFRSSPALTPLELGSGLPSWESPTDALLAARPVCLTFLESPLPTPSQVGSAFPLPDPPANSGLRLDGFEAIGAQFNPATYYSRFPRVSGQYDDNYTPFQLSGEQTRATVAIATYARDRRVPLVFVNLPLTQQYLDPVRRRREQQFRQHMQQLATQHQFQFRDLSQLWPTRNQYFADPSHLNQDGARAVARHLAQDLSIPWPAPESPGP